MSPTETSPLIINFCISSSNLEGMFNFPEVLTENQINVLENINFDE